MTRKGKARGTLADSIKEINQDRAKAFKEAGNEFGVASDANAAGSANLRRQLGRAENTLNKTVARQTGNVKQLSKRAKEVQRQTRAKQAAAVSRYGTSLGGSVNQQFQSAEATSAAGVQGMRGARTVQARGANAAKGVVGIARQGARAQEAAGDYALAQALQARYAVSADAAFEAKQALRLQQLEFEQQKKLLALQEKEDSGGVPGVTSSVTTAQSAAPELMRLLNDANAVEGAGKYANATEAAGQYLSDNAIDPGSNEGKMIIALASKMRQGGAGYRPATAEEKENGTDKDGDGWVTITGSIRGDQTQILKQATTQVFSGLYPDMWKKHREDILGNIDIAGERAWMGSLNNTEGVEGNNADGFNENNYFVRAADRVVDYAAGRGSPLSTEYVQTRINSMIGSDMPVDEVVSAAKQLGITITRDQVLQARKARQ